MTEKSLQYTFPWEEPTPSNFNLWKEAVARLCAGTTNLSYTLGPFLHNPHLPKQWFLTISSEALYLIGDDTTHPTYDVYILRVGRMETRHGWQYDWSSCEEGTHPGTHFASVTMISRTCAEMHLCTPFPVYTEPLTSFLEVLHSYED
jgi:hypothetical protein